MIFAEFDNTSQVSNKRHELLTHREHMCSPPVYLLVESVFLIFLVFYGVLCFFCDCCNVSSRLVSCVPTICLDRQFLFERFDFL